MLMGFFQMIKELVREGSTASTFAVVMLAGFVLFGFVSFNFFTPRSMADDHVTKSEFKAAIDEVQKFAEKANNAVNDLSREWRMADGISTYDQAETALYLHVRDEKINGVTPQSEERRHQLQRRLDQAKEYKECVIAQRDDCDRLRPR